MSKKKDRNRARRRAEQYMDQAWEAADAGKLERAAQLSGRAVAVGQVNPRIWNDHGSVMLLCEQLVEAEKAFRAAIALAPTYADAFGNLAQLQARLGNLPQAERLQQRVVELRPTDIAAQEALLSYQCLEGGREPAQGAVGEEARCIFTERTERFDWEKIEAELTARGVAHLPALLSCGESRELANLYAEEELFEHEVVQDDAENGCVSYRFLTRPLPRLVRELRTEVYARAARIANRWNDQLDRSDRYPGSHDAFLQRCRQAGQHRTTPILLRYERGGFNGLHQDVAGRLTFPLQLAVTLGPGDSRSGGGGEFVLEDALIGRKQRRTVVPTATGDGVLFCTRERLTRVAGLMGLVPVRHGLLEVRASERFALGIPFHENG